MGKVWKKGKKNSNQNNPKDKRNKETKAQRFHTEDSSLVSVKSLELASSFFFSTLRTHASHLSCLALHSLCVPMCNGQPNSLLPLTSLSSVDCKSKAVTFKQVPRQTIKPNQNLYPKDFFLISSVALKIMRIHRAVNPKSSPGRKQSPRPAPLRGRAPLKSRPLPS